MPRGGDRRAAILDAAIGVIARRGVRGFRVEQVAEQAGVAVSLLYYYFGSRNGLVRATLDHANERAATTTPGSGSGRATVEASLLAELDPDARDTSVVWGEVLASAVFEAELRDQLRDAGATWNDARRRRDRRRHRGRLDQWHRGRSRRRGAAHRPRRRPQRPLAGRDDRARAARASCSPAL